MLKRKKVLIISIPILIITSFLIFTLNTKNEQFKHPSQKQNYNNTVQNILAYNLENIDEPFLAWINNEYSYQVLSKLEKSLKDQTYTKNTWHQLTSNSLIVLQDKFNNKVSKKTRELTPKQNQEITLSFIGDVSLADNWYIMPKYDERGKKIDGILSKEITDTLKSADISVANNEFTISNRGTKMPKKYYTFRGNPNRLSIYEEMGINLVTLANNHIYDFGEVAFNDSIDALNQYNIPYIGAGKNIEEAKEPFYYIINGYKIAFVNATRAEKFILTPEATKTTGGVLRCYDPTLFINVIEEAKKQSDFVIVLIHWGKEDSSELEPVQIDTSKQYIDAGADLIVGTHAHTLQGIDFYNNKAIIYNLGDFIFNNETKDTAIFKLKIDKDGNFKYYFIPCLEKEEYTTLLTGNEKERVLNKMRNLSPNITITPEGEFYPNN